MIEEEAQVDLYGRLTPEEQRTLRLAPMWVLSSLVGRSRLETWELDALWDGVRRALPATSWLGAQALRAVLDDQDLVAAYERDTRPITTGLLQAVTASARIGAGAASSMRSALLAVGEQVARARGPFGRSISQQDADTLELLAEILDLEEADPRRLFEPA